MQFRKAIDHLQAGGQLRRRAWPADTYIDVPDRDSKEIVVKVEGDEPEPYLASGEDLLSSDWEHYEHPVKRPAPSPHLAGAGLEEQQEGKLAPATEPPPAVEPTMPIGDDEPAPEFEKEILTIGGADGKPFPTGDPEPPPAPAPKKTSKRKGKK